MWLTIFFSACFSVFAGCVSEAGNGSSVNRDVSRSIELSAPPLPRDWHKEIVVYEGQSRLCTKFVFNFLANFVLANNLIVPQATNGREIVDFMRLEKAIPVFKPSAHQGSRLEIDRFERCDQSEDALKAIREEAMAKLSLDALPMGNVASIWTESVRKKPTKEEWMNIRNQISRLRQEASPRSVSVLKRKLSDYLGTIDKEDDVIAIYTYDDYIPLSTVLRLQGRLVGFIGVTGPNDSMEEIDLDYVIDSVTEAEYKLLADSGYHITSHDLETNLYGEGLLPDLKRVKSLQPHRDEIERVSNEINLQYYRRFQENKKRMFVAFSSHEAVSLEIAANLNPSAKFLIVRTFDETMGVADARKRGIDTPVPAEPFWDPMTSYDFYTPYSHYERVFKEMALWLKARNVNMLLRSSGETSSMDKFVEEIWGMGQNISEIGRNISSLVVGEEYLIPTNRDRNTLNYFLTKYINIGFCSPILEHELKKVNIRMVQSVPNQLNYGFELRDRQRGWKGDSKKDAEILLTLEHISLASDLRHRYPDNIVKIGSASFPLKTQVKCFHGFSYSQELLKKKVAGLNFEWMFNWAVTHLVVDQGDNFAFFSDKRDGGLDLSYEGIFRIFEVHSPFWTENRHLKESFKGVISSDFGWGYVSHGTTSFAVPVAAMLLKKYVSKSLSKEFPNGYVRPFHCIKK